METLFSERRNIMETEKNTLGPAVVVALIATIVGAAVWALIVILFKYEVGIIAWALGGLSGYAVGSIAKQNVKSTHQLLSVISALLAILIGKYAAFAYSYNGKTIGGIFNFDTIPIFQKNLSLFFSVFDIIFIILAVVTAWQVPLQFKQAEENKDEIHQHIHTDEENQTDHNESNNDPHK